MATVSITNVNALGSDLDVPIIGRIVAFGESVDVDAEIAGTVPDPKVEGDVGTGLLAQVGTWAPTPAKKSSNNNPAVSTPPSNTEGE